jgi:L-aspartate oxidase
MKNYEVIIVGGGAAGLYAALSFPECVQVLVLDKYNCKKGNSNLAQGGIAGVWNSPDDSKISHEKDTLNAGGYANDLDAVQVLVDEAELDLSNLVKLGVDFDRKNGDFHRTLEGGHSHRRIFHHKDTTGKEIMDVLVKNAKKRENITVLDNDAVLFVKKSITGFSILTVNSAYNCHFLIIATGGIGDCFKYSTNSGSGDGICFAYNLGAKIKNISKIQFHPTAFKSKDTKRRFLISEAVRGEGAYLLNSKFERFMSKYDERLELAPRDVVSKAMMQEGDEIFYIDISHKPEEEIKSHFPTIYSELLTLGYNLCKDKVPVFPCQHYLMGGINVDINANTNIENLYAVGECSHTGLHGNNRLASNSLMEACVFSRRAAEDITKKIVEKPYAAAEFSHNGKKIISISLREEIQEILQESFFVLPNYAVLEKNLAKIDDIYNSLKFEYYKLNADFVEIYSSVTVTRLILKELMENKEK